jgi:hypothetical protein
MSAPDEPPASDTANQYLRPPFVDEERIALAAASLKPTVDELLVRLRAGEKIAPEDYAQALLALGIQYQRYRKDTAPVPVEFIRLLAGQILGPKRAATFEQRLAEFEDYVRRHPKATPSEIAHYFEQPGVRGWSSRTLRRRIGEWLLNKAGHSD